MNKPHTKLFNVLEESGGGGGNNTYDFRNDLPEDIRKEAVFDTIKAKDSKEALALLGKGYVHAQKLIGVNRLETPKADWTPDKWANFNKALGVPEDHTKYETPEYKFKAKDISLVPEKLEGYKKLFKEIGIRPDQAKRLQEEYFKDIDGQVFQSQTDREKAANSAKTVLKEKYGDTYDAKIQIGKAAIKKFGSEALLEKLSNLGAIDDPDVIQFIVNVGEQTIEDNGIGGGDGLPIGGRAKALEEINALKLDKNFQTTLNDRNAPGHKEAVEKWMSTFTAAFPNERVQE